MTTAASAAQEKSSSLFDQLKESRQIRGEGQLQTGEFQIGSISDLGGVVLRSFGCRRLPQRSGHAGSVVRVAAIARRIGEGQ